MNDEDEVEVGDVVAAVLWFLLQVGALAFLLWTWDWFPFRLSFSIFAGR